MTLNTVNEVAASTLLDHGSGNALPKKKKKLTLWEKVGLFFTYIFLTLVALMVVLSVFGVCVVLHTIYYFAARAVEKRNKNKEMSDDIPLPLFG